MLLNFYSGRRQHDRVRDGRGEGGRPDGGHRHHALSRRRRNRQEEGKLIGISPRTRFDINDVNGTLLYQDIF